MVSTLGPRFYFSLLTRQVQKGRSQEEKEKALLDFFHSSSEFFNLKELETVGAKKVGVSGMQIKPLLKCLTDNSLVKCEKIGSGNYYWAFPSDGRASLANRFASLQDKAAAQAAEVDSLAVQVDDAAMKRQFLV